MTRACGGCTQCCELVPVREIGVRAFAGCPHRQAPPALKVGCAIYSTRPTGCRLWSCVWLDDLGMGDELRPDRCGVVFDQVPDVLKVDGTEHPCIQAWVRPDVPKRFWTEEPIFSVVLAILGKDMAVLFRRSPSSAFAVFRSTDGVIASNEDAPTVPNTTEPDAIRLRRAAVLAAQHGVAMT